MGFLFDWCLWEEGMQKWAWMAPDVCFDMGSGECNMGWGLKAAQAPKSRQQEKNCERYM